MLLHIALISTLSSFALISTSNVTDVPPSQAESSTPATEGAPTPQAEAFFFTPFSSQGGFLETAAKTVAQLVSSNFAQPKKSSPSSENDIVSSLLRLMGFEKSKLSAIAVNAIIFIAQLVGSSMSEKNWDDKYREQEDIPPPGSPIGWIFDNSPVEARKLVHAAEDSTLPTQLIDLVRLGESDATDCVQLLICTAAPVVWSMQRFLYKTPDPTWPSMTPLQRMFAHLPTFKQLIQHSEGCDVQFPLCKDHYRKRRH